MHQQETFRDYLKSIGFRESGASEVMERLAHNRGDREDHILLQEYLTGKESLIKNLNN